MLKKLSKLAKKVRKGSPSAHMASATNKVNKDLSPTRNLWRDGKGGKVNTPASARRAATGPQAAPQSAVAKKASMSRYVGGGRKTTKSK